jgi:hypothetical protein
MAMMFCFGWVYGRERSQPQAAVANVPHPQNDSLNSESVKTDSVGMDGKSATAPQTTYLVANEPQFPNPHLFSESAKLDSISAPQSIFPVANEAKTQISASTSAAQTAPPTASEAQPLALSPSPFHFIRSAKADSIIRADDCTSTDRSASLVATETQPHRSAPSPMMGNEHRPLNLSSSAAGSRPRLQPFLRSRTMVNEPRRHSFFWATNEGRPAPS